MTRTSCTHLFNKKRSCEPYSCPPYATGFCEATDSTAVTLSGWKVKSLPQQLGSVNNRQMSDRHCERFSDSLCQLASTGTPAKSYIIRRAKLTNRSGGERFVRERCYTKVQPSTSREFLLNSLPSTQERRTDEASYKPQETEQVGGIPSLQNGGNGDTQRVAEGQQLDGEGGSERCLRTSRSPHQPLLRFMVGQEHYQFTYLPLGLSCASWVFTKVMKPVTIFLQSMRVHMIVYIDDIMLMGESPNQVESHLEALVYILTGLGFVINIPKSVMIPSQQIEYLGMLVDSTTLHLSLPGEKLHHIRVEIGQMTQRALA